jgi:hypothetical protein
VNTAPSSGHLMSMVSPSPCGRVMALHQSMRGPSMGTSATRPA